MVERDVYRDDSRDATVAETMALVNLLNDASELASLALRAVRRRSWLNAFLLAAGLDQIVEDALHRSPLGLAGIADQLAPIRKPAGPIASRAVRRVEGALWRLRASQPRARRLVRWHADFAGFVQCLAEAAVSPPSPSPETARELAAVAEALLPAVGSFPPALAREVVRLPSGFRSFDQHPDDLDRLARRFAERWPDRSRPLAVVGVRTSGSYLAPLQATSLRRQGYRDVRALTYRPGSHLFEHERAALRDVVGRGGLVLLSDDPPERGATLADAADGLADAGVPAGALVILVQLLGPRDSLPRALRRYASVTLPWDAWRVHERLAPAAVRPALEDMLGPSVAVREVVPLELPASWTAPARGHARARYRVHLGDRRTGRDEVRHVMVRGVGLGYFGEHALAVARRLRGFVPDVFGLRDGLLYQAWPRQDRPLPMGTPAEQRAAADAVARYVWARHRALAVRADVSTRLSGRRPVWEAVADVLNEGFGRAAPLTRPVLRAAMRRLLRVGHHSVVDGATDPPRWLAGETPDSPLKADFDERAFSNLDGSCYDPVFDLAGFAAGCEDPAVRRMVREAYAARAGERVGPERWWLYQLFHLRRLQRDERKRRGELPETQRALARRLQDFYEEVWFRDLPVPRAGPLCAIDVDGVLESGWLGFPATTPAGVRTLRSLTLHGYRPVLVTGRSLGEVRERCGAYHLAGGVAEYGAAIYVHADGRERVLASRDELARLDRLRCALRDMDGVLVDPELRYAVRAYRFDSTGRRRGLRPDTIALALATAQVEQDVRPVVGASQTDFTVAGVDKGTGLRALVEELAGKDGAAATPVALAVGDAVSDLPIFRAAHIAAAPSNADASVRSSGAEIARGAYQAGLARAAARLLGHEPGGCAVCRDPRVSAGARVLFAALAARNGGVWGALRDAVARA